MNLDEAAAPQEMPAVAAPRRAIRLTAKPPPSSNQERLALRRERKERQQAEAEAARRSGLEKKLAGMHDAHEMLRVVDTELTLQRARRLAGAGGNTQQALRVLSIAVLFALLIAGLGAMFWMQDRLARTGFSRHRVETSSQK